MDTNSVERAMRPIALNRKNSLFAGHDEGAADLLDEHAALIPRMILVLRKLARIRLENVDAHRRPRKIKVGRNDPCRCGSGQKFKRCCGRG
jgi:uncharacterized protein YecA (UPF0149 family)